MIGDREEAITMSAAKEEDGSQRLLFEVSYNLIARLAPLQGFELAIK